MPSTLPNNGSNAVPSRIHAALLGAALTVIVGVVGLVLPAVAAATRGVMHGLGAALPPPTEMVLSASPWGLVLVAFALGLALVLKERLIGRRAALAANLAALAVASLFAAAALVAVIMPLIRIGESLSGR